MGSTGIFKWLSCQSLQGVESFSSIRMWRKPVRHTWSPCGAPLCGSLRRWDTNTPTILHGPPQHVRGRTGAALSRGSLSFHPVWRCSREAASQESLSRLCRESLPCRDGCNQPVSLPFRVQYSQGEVLILKAREVFGKSSAVFAL